MTARTTKRQRPKHPAVAPPKLQVLVVRGCPEWKEWLIDLAEANRSDMADLVDDALELYARSKGFRAPPRR